MKIYKEERLRNFEFWGGAIDRANKLTFEQLDEIENILEEVYPEGLSETEINDLFWFEEYVISQWLGFDNFEELEESNAARL